MQSKESLESIQAWLAYEVKIKAGAYSLWCVWTFWSKVKWRQLLFPNFHKRNHQMYVNLSYRKEECTTTKYIFDRSILPQLNIHRGKIYSINHFPFIFILSHFSSRVKLKGSVCSWTRILVPTFLFFYLVLSHFSQRLKFQLWWKVIQGHGLES